MKVLIVSHKPPYPPKDGGCLAIYNLACGLHHKNVKVDLFTIETHKHPFHESYRSEIPFNIESQFIDTKIKPFSALNSLLKDQSYNISRFYNKNFEKELIKKLKATHYDIIQLESLFVTPYINAIRANTKSKIVYRSHNVEYKIWKHLADGEKRFFKRSYLKKLSNQLKEYEYNTLNKYDGAVFITDNDQEYYSSVGSKKPHLTVPFSVNMSQYQPKKSTNKSICYLGSMDWLPNSEGIDWFLNNVWQSLESTTDIDFYLAGKNMPGKYFKMSSTQLHVLGEVHDAIEFINNHSIMIVPLFSGSGMRVKIIEAMALGKVVIGTPLSFQGIEKIEDSKNALIAETPDQFYNKIAETINNKEILETISANARSLIKNHYGTEPNSEKLINFYKSLI